MTARLQARGSRVAAVPALEAELRESPHRNAIFLVRPGELQPELPLRNHRGGVAAGDEDPEGGIAQGAELMDARFQRAELSQGPARQNPQSLLWAAQSAHVRSASNSAVVSSSSAITSQ